MPFRAFRLRGEKILVRVDDGGAPVGTSDGRVDVIYKAGGKVYRASARNLTPDVDARLLSDGEAAPGEVAPQKDSAAKIAKPVRKNQVGDGSVGSTAALPVDAVIAYTDGACSGNPGPMGVGVVLYDPVTKDRRERSEYLGVGTNNIAELVAIQRALELAPSDRPLVVHSDSAYALGLLALGWKAKANQELVADLRALVKLRPDLRLVKVRGHSGVPENERADELATSAVARRDIADTHVPKTR